LIYFLFCGLFYAAMSQGLSRSVEIRCDAGLVPVQYCKGFK